MDLGQVPWDRFLGTGSLGQVPGPNRECTKVRKKTLYVLLAALALLGMLVFLGCAKEGDKGDGKQAAKEPDKVAVRVNGDPITEGMIERELRKLGSQHSKSPDALKSEEMREAIIKNLVGEALLLQGARNKGIEVSGEEVEAKLAFVKEQLGVEGFAKKIQRDGLDEATFRDVIKNNMMNQRFANSFVSRDSVTEDDAKKIYTESPIPFIHQAQLKLRFIQVPTFDRADAVMKDIMARGFEEVAGEMEDKGEGMVSGYGWTSPGMYSSDIADGLRGLEAGATGGPYEGRQGYFIFHVEEKKPERPKSFKEVKGQIIKDLYKEKKRVALAHWLGAQRDAAIIEKID